MSVSKEQPLPKGAEEGSKDACSNVPQTTDTEGKMAALLAGITPFPKSHAPLTNDDSIAGANNVDFDSVTALLLEYPDGGRHGLKKGKIELSAKQRVRYYEAVDRTVSQASAVEAIITDFSSDRLATLHFEIRNAFARAIGESTADIARDRRINRIAGRMKWEDAKKKDPNISIIKHIDNTYPDRRQIGMCRHDLADTRVDPELYAALSGWLKRETGGVKNRLPDGFGLPKNSEVISERSKNQNDNDDPAERIRARAALRKRKQRQLAKTAS